MHLQFNIVGKTSILFVWVSSQFIGQGSQLSDSSINGNVDGLGMVFWEGNN